MVKGIGIAVGVQVFWRSSCGVGMVLEFSGVVLSSGAEFPPFLTLVNDRVQAVFGLLRQELYSPYSNQCTLGPLLNGSDASKPC